MNIKKFTLSLLLIGSSLQAVDRETLQLFLSGAGTFCCATGVYCLTQAADSQRKLETQLLNIHGEISLSSWRNIDTVMGLVMIGLGTSFFAQREK